MYTPTYDGYLCKCVLTAKRSEPVRGETTDKEVCLLKIANTQLATGTFLLLSIPIPLAQSC